MKARPGMKVYYDGSVYEVALSPYCSECALWIDKRCSRPICTRFDNFGEPYIFKFVGQFHPVYLDSLRYTSTEQRQRIYEVHKREIQEYRRALAKQLSGDIDDDAFIY